MAKDIKQITADLRKLIADAQDALDERTAAAIGYTVRARMLSLISKGVSPILNAGRFPGYIGATIKSNARSELKNAKKLFNFRKNNQRYNTKLSRGSKGRLNREKRKQLRIDKKSTSLAFNQKKKQLTSEIKKKYYPFSVQSEFPDKRPRPVNLFLSGDFLSNLSYALGIRGKAQVIEIGFFDDLSAKKESGHRDGVNGQPKRPIIPTGSERFSAIIAQDIATIARQALNKFFRGK